MLEIILMEHLHFTSQAPSLTGILFKYKKVHNYIQPKSSSWFAAMVGLLKKQKQLLSVFILTAEISSGHACLVFWRIKYSSNLGTDI